MRIVGMGTDIVECARIRRLIEKHGEAFLGKVFSEREISYCQARKKSTEFFAAHWAAKTAVVMAIGANRGKEIRLIEIELTHDANGRLSVTLMGSLRELAVKLRVQQISVSMAHCRSYATASACAEAQDKS